MKSIEVSAAIITDGDKILAAQRGYGDMKDGWEFPGGKLEPGEAAKDCCMREIEEELAIGIECEDELCCVEWDYPKFHLSMHCFVSHIVEGKLEMKEHEALRWIGLDDLDSLDWLDADKLVVKAIKEKFGR